MGVCTPWHVCGRVHAMTRVWGVYTMACVCESACHDTCLECIYHGTCVESSCHGTCVGECMP